MLSPGGQVASAMVTCAQAGSAHEIHRHGGRRRARAHPDGKPARLGHQPGARAAAAWLRESVGLYHHRPLDRRADGAVAAAGVPAHCTGRDHARTDHVRAPAAHRRPRHGRRGTRRAHRRTGGHARDRRCGHDLSRLRSRAAVRGLPGGQLRISRAVDQRERSVQSARDDSEGIQDARGGDDAGRARIARALRGAISCTRRPSW